MVAYFKLQNNLFMAVGAVVGFLIGYLVYGDKISGSIAVGFLLVLPALVGLVVGRLASAWWSNRRLAAMYALLYQKGDADGFLAVFEPKVAKVPKTTIEYVDGMNRIAYAYEAKGEYEKALEILNGLKPEELRLHMLVATATTLSQKIRLYLLMERKEQAKEVVADLRELKETAVKRAPAVSANLEQCLRLYENWLNLLDGETCDLEYIREEARLANNPIHKREMEQLLKKADKKA